MHLAPLTTKKERTTPGRPVLVLEAVYSSLGDPALTHILDDVKTDALSEIKAGSALQQVYSTVQPCYLGHMDTVSYGMKSSNNEKTCSVEFLANPIG